MVGLYLGGAYIRGGGLIIEGLRYSCCFTLYHSYIPSFSKEFLFVSFWAQRHGLFYQVPRLQSVQHQVSGGVSVFRQSLTRTKTPASVKECMSCYENGSSTNRYILKVRSFFFYKSRSRFSVAIVCLYYLP